MASTSTRKSSTQLMRVLAKPSRVAKALDWKRSTGGAIATLDVHADRIGVRISQHPKTSTKTLTPTPTPLQSGSSSAKEFPGADANANASNHHCHYSLPFSRKGESKISESTKQDLSDLVYHHGVCGFVVAWPLQEDTGLMGAACGRTLFAIEELLRDDYELARTSTATANDTSTMNDTARRPVFAESRPLCLWDGSHPPNHIPVGDAFGRSPSFARTSDKTEHIASCEKYENQIDSVVVSRVWDDFVRTHWPEINLDLDLDRGQSQQQQQHKQSEQAGVDNPAEDVGEASYSQQQWKATIVV